MPRSASRLALLALLALLLSPARADASLKAFWDWLDQLSGPGPFHGPSVTVPLACGFGRFEGDRLSAHEFDPVHRCLFPTLVRRPVPPPGEMEIEGEHWRRTVSVELHLARLSTGRNELQYAQPPADPGVNWFRLGPGIVWHVSRHVDVQTSLEWNRLTSKGDVFDAITVTTWEPVGVTVRPLAHLRNRWGGLSIAVRTSRLLRSLDAGEFGAIPGSYQTGKETQLRLAIGYDLWSLR